MKIAKTSLFHQELEKFTDDLSSHMLYEPIKYILSLDAKRIRPTLFLNAVKTFNGNLKEAMPLALAIEVFHNFTLLHDDIMDTSSLRRGKPTVHEKWDVNTAILAGDAMMILAYQLIGKIPSKHLPSILEKFNKMSLLLCEGQQDDMQFERREKVTIEEYIQMITNKTSVLLAFSLEAGAIISETPPNVSQKMHKFGLNLGLGFQLQDDYLDLYPKSKAMGKEVGGDIKNNKKALPLLVALNNQNLKEEITVLLQNQTVQTVPNIIQLFNKNEVPKKCETIINQYYSKAKNNLSEIEGYDTKIFLDFCNSLQGRIK